MKDVHHLPVLLFGLCCLCMATPSRSRAEDSVPLSSLRLDHDRLKTWGTRKYKIITRIPQASGKSKLVMGGTLVMITKVTDTSILFLERRPILTETYDYTLACRKNALLTPSNMSIKCWSGGALAVKGMLAMSANKASGTMGDTATSFVFPSRTLTRAAALRIVTLLPRKAGAVYSFKHFSEVHEMSVTSAPIGTPFTITCHGQVTVTVKGKPLPWTRFRISAGRSSMEVYVDRKNVVQRIIQTAQGNTTMELIR